MSGSSIAERELSRCVVTMDAGICISWDSNPDGSYPGTEYHDEEEDGFRQTIDKKASEIEALFDEMEQSGRCFTLTTHASFHKKCQHAESRSHTIIVKISLLSEPKLSKDVITQLTEKVAQLLIPALPDPELL